MHPLTIVVVHSLCMSHNIFWKSCAVSLLFLRGVVRCTVMLFSVCQTMMVKDLGICSLYSLWICVGVISLRTCTDTLLNASLLPLQFPCSHWLALAASLLFGLHRTKLSNFLFSTNTLWWPQTRAQWVEMWKCARAFLQVRGLIISYIILCFAHGSLLMWCLHAGHGFWYCYQTAH